jgi:hypothetical protein
MKGNKWKMNKKKKKKGQIACVLKVVVEIKEEENCGSKISKTFVFMAQ